MEHENVHLMQGLLQEWVKAGGPVDYNPTAVPTLSEVIQLVGRSTY